MSIDPPLHISGYVAEAAERARTSTEGTASARRIEAMKGQLRVLTERKIAAWDAYWMEASMPVPSEMEVRVSREMRVSALYDAHQSVCHDIFQLKRDIMEWEARGGVG